MIQPDAKLYRRDEPWGTWIEWVGGRYAAIPEPFDVDGRPEVHKIVRLRNLRLQLIERCVSFSGAYDSWIVAQADDPIAWLRGALRGQIRSGLNFVFRCEAACLAFRLKYDPGARARFTGWLAGKLL